MYEVPLEYLHTISIWINNCCIQQLSACCTSVVPKSWATVNYQTMANLELGRPSSWLEHACAHSSTCASSRLVGTHVHAGQAACMRASLPLAQGLYVFVCVGPPLAWPSSPLLPAGPPSHNGWRLLLYLHYIGEKHTHYGVCMCMYPLFFPSFILYILV